MAISLLANCMQISARPKYLPGINFSHLELINQFQYRCRKWSRIYKVFSAFDFTAAELDLPSRRADKHIYTHRCDIRVMHFICFCNASLHMHISKHLAVTHAYDHQMLPLPQFQVCCLHLVFGSVLSTSLSELLSLPQIQVCYLHLSFKKSCSCDAQVCVQQIQEAYIDVKRALCAHNSDVGQVNGTRSLQNAVYERDRCVLATALPATGWFYFRIGVDRFICLMLFDQRSLWWSYNGAVMIIAESIYFLNESIVQNLYSQIVTTTSTDQLSHGLLCADL